MTLTEASTANTSQGQAGVTGRVVDGIVIWLRGEYDLASVRALSETMSGAIARREDTIVLDLSGVEFMDASTIGVIINSRNELELQHRSLTLRAPSKVARRILEICCLAELLDPSPGDSTTAGGPVSGV
jgi:anti-anti-sigma factor